MLPKSFVKLKQTFYFVEHLPFFPHGASTAYFGRFYYSSALFLVLLSL